MITRQTIDLIFETARIEEVIGDFVNLKKSGSSFKGLSPFSNEKTPSFMVSPGKGIYKDFSSGKGGNVVSFLMDHEHYTYPEALRYLAKKYNIEIEEAGQTDEQKEARSHRESLFLVNDFANRWFQTQLWDSAEGQNIGLSYFKERGFTEETLKEFQLGYSPEKYEALYQAATNDNYQLEFLQETGLVKVDGERKTDRFRGRVMFPILSHTGRVLGFGGRTLKKEAKIAKYLNSPESDIYHKSKTLYGLFQAKTEISKQEHCLLVEGYTDVISLHQAGVKNVVASSGTALTVDQINLIKRYTENITILYDGDAAGIKASLRGIDLILQEGMRVKVLLFPEGEDPDSYAQKVSTSELTDFIAEEAVDFLRFKAKLLLADAGDNPLEKSKAAREMVQSIALIPDALERNAYITESARLLDLDEKVLFSELAQIRKSLSQQEERRAQPRNMPPEMQVVEEPTAPSATSTPFYEQEKALCWLLLNYGENIMPADEDEENNEEEEAFEESVAEFILQELTQDKLELLNPGLNQIFKAFLNHYNQSGGILRTEELLRSENKALVNLSVDLVTEKYNLHNWQARKIYLPEHDAFVPSYTEQSVLRYKEKRIGGLIKEIQTKLQQGDGDPLVMIETMQKLNTLRLEINKELNRIV